MMLDDELSNWTNTEPDDWHVHYVASCPHCGSENTSFLYENDYGQDEWICEDCDWFWVRDPRKAWRR